MTIRVEIKHTQRGYDKAITVEEVGVDVNGEHIHRGDAYKTVVMPGGMTEKYVYGSQALIITEGPDVARSSTPDAEQPN